MRCSLNFSNFLSHNNGVALADLLGAHGLELFVLSITSVHLCLITNSTILYGNCGYQV